MNPLEMEKKYQKKDTLVVKEMKSHNDDEALKPLDKRRYLKIRITIPMRHGWLT